MVAICVDFEIELASLDAFLTIMQRNASDSFTNEASCHWFGITQGHSNSKKVYLYKLYDDAVNFEPHKKVSHYLEFNDAISGMGIKKSIGLLEKINH